MPRIVFIVRNRGAKKVLGVNGRLGNAVHIILRNEPTSHVLQVHTIHARECNLEIIPLTWDVLCQVVARGWR